MLKRNRGKLIVGAALAVTVTTLWPVMKNSFKPAAEAGRANTDGLAGGLAGRIQNALQVARGEIENIVVEAQFERMRKRLDREIAAEPELPAGKMEDLQSGQLIH